VPRRLLICLAFATWCFSNTWVQYGEGGVAYFARYDPLRAVAIPVAGCEILIALSLWAAWEICRRGGWQRSRVPHVLFLLSCLAPLGIASVAMLRVTPFDLVSIVRGRWFWPVALAAALVPAAAAARNPIRASRLMREALLFSWPVLAIVLIQAARSTLFRYSHATYADRPLAPFLPGSRLLPGSQPGVRVVWIILDELSQTIAFDNRPAGLDLPNLDRLRAESFYATSAESPADWTERSLPDLIVGQDLGKSIPEDPDNLLMAPRPDSKPFAWSSIPNVFDTAREMGLNTALAGWDHPYCRVLNRSLTKCYWTAGWLPPGVEETFEPQPLPAAMWYRAKLQFAALPLLGHLPGIFPGFYARQEMQRRFSPLLGRAVEFVSDPSIGLVLIHLPIPHPPSIYDRGKRAFAARGPNGYADNVALADDALGAIRRAMERAGLWDRTAVLVSADHGWRTGLWRGTAEWTREDEALSHQDTSGVPFLLKLPSQTSPFGYAEAFNTVVTRQIITEILQGKLQEPSQILDCIASRKARP
jgi:hypothetical protein